MLTPDIRPLISEPTLDPQPQRSPIAPDRVTVFLASWPASDNKGLTAIQHTPDICWGGSGWKPLHLGQPSQITIEIPIQERQETKDQRPKTKDSEVLGPWSLVSGPPHDSQPSTTNSQPQKRPSTAKLTSDQVLGPWSLVLGPSFQPLPFDFRIFELPNNQIREAVAWCALAGGQPLIGTTEWGRESISRDPVVYYYWIRAVHFRQILHAAQNRLPVRREKQFVRYSAPLNSGWRVGIETMNTFGPVWLTASPL